MNLSETAYIEHLSENSDFESSKHSFLKSFIKGEMYGKETFMYT